MAKNNTQPMVDPELAAINAVILAIRELDAVTQQRVIDYVISRFNLRATGSDFSGSGSEQTYDSSNVSDVQGKDVPTNDQSQDGDSLEGISPVARKWMSRNGLKADRLSTLFSLGIDEIDLIAKKVPGRSQKDRMRSVFLLKGIAAYLGSGVARVTHEQAKETCLHYNAFDTDNFATYLKRLSSEVGGTKESGYTLTARGLTAATEMVNELLNSAGK